MPHVLIENGVVVQLDLTGNPPEGYVEAPDYVQPGYTYDGEWHAPAPDAPLAPRKTAMWRARAVAKATPFGVDTLYNSVVDAIAEIEDPLTKAAAEEAWERGTEFDLDGQMVPMLMAALELTEADVLPLIEAAEALPA